MGLWRPKSRLYAVAGQRTRGEPERRSPQVRPAGHRGCDGFDRREHRARDRLLLRVRSDRCHRWRRGAADDPCRGRGRRAACFHGGRVHQGGALGGELHHLCGNRAGSQGRCRHGPAGRGRVHHRLGGGVHHVGRDGGHDPRPLHRVASPVGAAGPGADRGRDLADRARRQAVDRRGGRGRARAGDDHGRGLRRCPGRSACPSVGHTVLLGAPDRWSGRPLRRLPAGPVHVHRVGERPRARRGVP